MRGVMFASMAASVLLAASPAWACRIPATPERLAAAYERQLERADQVLVGEVSGKLLWEHAAYGVELTSVRALRGAAPEEMTVESEPIVTCMPNFTAELARIDFERVLILLSGGEPLSIHRIDSDFARSALARLDTNAE